MKALDEKYSVSENILTDMLLDGSRLDKQEKLMILTSVGNKKVFQKVADAMTTQHPRLHEYEKKSFVSGGRKAWQDSPRKPSGKRTSKFMTKAFMAHADCADESCCEQSDGESGDGDEENLTGYYCLSSGADEEFEDVAGRIGQDLVVAFFANAESEDDIDPNIAEACAQAVFDEQVAVGC